MEEVILDAIRTTLNSFDFSFCITINIGTYVIIKSFTDLKPRLKFNTWQKRLVLIIFSLIGAIIYYYQGIDIKTIFNSIILAPVSWSWIFKPICNKFNIDYTKK